MLLLTIYYDYDTVEHLRRYFQTKPTHTLLIFKVDESMPVF